MKNKYYFKEETVHTIQNKIILTLLLLTSSLAADEVSFSLYNDWFAGSDKHFTNGVSIAWLNDAHGEEENSTNTNSYSETVYKIVKSIPFIPLDDTKIHNAGISISQFMLTPTNTEIATPQYDDIPYAGYLNIAFFLFESDSESFKEIRIELGVVGENSGAQWAQDTVHRLIGDTESLGWNTQLDTRYTINALLRYGEISWKKTSASGLKMDWFNNVGTEFGNLKIDAFAGTMFRLGKNYTSNFNVHYPYLREDASLIQLEKKHTDFGWDVSAGVDSELLAYWYISNEARKEGYNLSDNLLNLSAYLGTDLYYNLHKVTLFYRAQSASTNDSNSVTLFGGLIYSYQF